MTHSKTVIKKMNEETIHEVNAQIALAEYNKKDKLEKIVEESFLHYYFIGIRKWIGYIFPLTYLVAVISLNPKSTPYLLFFYFCIYILLELNRQDCRFNALVKLREI